MILTGETTDDSWRNSARGITGSTTEIKAPMDLPQRGNVVSLQLAEQELSVIGIHQVRVIDRGPPTGSCRGTGG